MINKIFYKIRKYGFLGSFKIAKLHFWNAVNTQLFYYYSRNKAINNNLIVMESEGDLSDNSYALYNYMSQNGYLKKYHVVWLVDNLSEILIKSHTNPELFANTEFLQKSPQKINKRWAAVMATCKWYIYDHKNMFYNLKKRDQQRIINLWHGVGYKAKKGNSKQDRSPCDMLVSLGDKSTECLSYFCNCPKDKIRVLGYPRTDYFFKNSVNANNFCKSLFKVSSSKIALWMPTFRKSISKEISESYDLGETGLPILKNDEIIESFNSFLNELNVVIVLKIHHLQANLPSFKKKYSNLIFLHDSDLSKNGIQLYEFVSCTDMLITDYSSIAIDYLLLDRPIIFTLDDYEKYSQSRGLYPHDAKNYMPGAHVFNYNEFCEAIKDACYGNDKFADFRHKLVPMYHKYVDGDSSKRILEYLDL